ncbi:hypothetical protein HMPREF1870_00396 [Bacteroidales bacterium KA00344]|nr:hypothetical protein HMPREF1870_00396 [Bacteroidales bacterium KA00344]
MVGNTPKMRVFDNVLAHSCLCIFNGKSSEKVFRYAPRLGPYGTVIEASTPCDCGSMVLPLG